MRRSMMGVWCVLSLAVMVCAAGHAGDDPAKAEKSKNLIQEPSFEGAPGVNGLPAGWEGPHAMPAGAFRASIVKEGKTGEKALLLEGNGEFGVVWGEKIAIDPAKRYRARGYVRIEGDEKGAADVKLHYYGENQEYLGQSRVGYVNPRTKGWQLITVTDQIDLFPKVRYLSIAVAMTVKGKAWYDDIELYSVTEKRGPINLIANGDMEDVAADRTAGLYVAAPDGSTPLCRFDEKIKKEGERSLYLETSGEWVSASFPSIAVEKGKTYVLTGSARARRGVGRVEIGYMQGGMYLGKTSSDEVTSDDWQSRTVTSELKQYPSATHIIAIATGEGDMAAWFDGFSMTSKSE